MLYLFCFYGGELVQIAGQSVEYRGGHSDGLVLNEGTSFEQLSQDICQRLQIDSSGKLFKYTVKFDKSCPQPLRDDVGVSHLLLFNEGSASVYVFDKEEPPLPYAQNLVGDHTSQMCLNRHNSLPSSDVSTPLTNATRTTSLSNADSSDLANKPFGCTSSRKGPLVSNIWENSLCGKGQVFNDAVSFRESLYHYSIAARFQYKFKRNEKHHVSACCAIDGCMWYVKAISIKNSTILRVKDFVNIHKHSARDECTLRPSVNSKQLAAVIEKKMRSSPGYLPRQICKDMKDDHAMSLSYMQGWRAKEYSKRMINGNVDDSYKLVPWICKKIIDSNPGSIANWTATVDNRFKQLFIAYGCSISGFVSYCRPIIFVDSCFLSGPYKGALFSATALDADNHLYPLAFGVLSSENYEDWLWFLHNLKCAIRDTDVTIVSDRHKALISSVSEVFGAKNHAHCLRHLKENFSSEVTRLKIGKQDAKKVALQLFDYVAYARLELDYEKSMRNLSNFSQELATWVTNNGPEHWANSKFPKMRWDRLESNAAESFNAWVKAERSLPIFQFIEAHMSKLAMKLYNLRVELEKWQYEVGPNIEKKLRDNIERGKKFVVTRHSAFQFLVGIGKFNLRVDLENWSCTCMEWQMSRIPCAHVCSAIEEAKFNVYHYVDRWYKRETQEKIYAEYINPVETHDMPKLDNIMDVMHSSDVPLNIRPPRNKRPPGRPRVKRIESQFMEKRTLHCSRCSEPGHNRSRCNNPIPDV